MKKCTCFEFRQKDYKEREAKVYKNIDEIIAKMNEPELRKELRISMRYRVQIVSFPCLCLDMEEIK